MPEITTPEITINPQNHTDVSDLIGRPPSWLLRSGIAMIGLVFGSILLISYFIKYPDKIQGTGIMTSTEPPIELLTKASGYLEDVLIQEGQEVTEGESLFYIKNTTEPGEIEILEYWIEGYESVHYPKEYLQMSIPSQLQLGVLQSDYASLQLKFNELKQNLRQRIVFEQMDNISNEIFKIKKLNQSLRKEKEIYQKELALEQVDYNRNEGLEQDGVISTQDKEKAMTSLLQKQRQYESMENSIIQNRIRMEQLELEILKLKGERASLIQNYQFALNEIIARIKSNIANWQQTYIISAPIAGQIALAKNMHKNKAVKIEQVLGHIIPSNGVRPYFSCSLPINNIGKIEIGQKALIKLDAYPHKEYGMIVSEVAQISSIPELNDKNESYYELRIEIQDSIMTDTGKSIPYKPNMTAQVEIITEDKTVFSRVFDQLISMLK